MRVERVVLDTNVLISAILSPVGKPFVCLHWALTHATLLVSRELLDELESRLARPKFAKYVGEATRRAVIADLAVAAVEVKLAGTLKACRDPDDDKLLEIAFLGHADCLVTGDRDLLVLHPFEGIPILSPADFVDLLVQQSRQE
jgi:uncharacterized protein